MASKQLEGDVDKLGYLVLEWVLFFSGCRSKILDSCFGGIREKGALIAMNKFYPIG
jgi:hypothetical protein